MSSKNSDFDPYEGEPEGTKEKVESLKENNITLSYNDLTKLLSSFLCTYHKSCTGKEMPGSAVNDMEESILIDLVGHETPELNIKKHIEIQKLRVLMI